MMKFLTAFAASFCAFVSVAASETTGNVSAHSRESPPEKPLPKRKASSKNELHQKESKAAVDISSSVLVASTASGVGSAFIAEMSGKYFIITNVHVVSDDMDIAFHTLNGIPVNFPNKGFASDLEDVYMIPLASLPEGTKALPISENVVSDTQKDDEIMVCGNPLGGGVLHNTFGRLLAVGPHTLELDTALFNGNSGGPVYHIKSGKVIGVATRVHMIGSGNSLTSHSSRMDNSPIRGKARFFGLRIDSVQKWTPYTPQEIGRQQRELRLYTQRFEIIRKCKDDEHKSVEVAKDFPDVQKIIYKYWNTKDAAMAARRTQRRYREQPRNASPVLTIAERELCEEMALLLRHEIARLKSRKYCGHLRKEVSALVDGYEAMYNYYDTRAKRFNR